jgi:predicted amidohydrolase
MSSFLPTRWTVGLVQYAPTFGRKVENLMAVEALLRDVRADLVVLPELFATGYLFRDAAEAYELAEPIPDGPTCQALWDWSRRWDMAIVAGMAERAPDGVYNSAVLVDARTGTLEVYRKVHLFAEEKVWFRPGNLGFRVFPVRGVQVGVMICFDWIFPEACRTLALKGAQVIAHPSNLVLPYCQRAMPIRSLENRVFCVTANRTGEDVRGDDRRLVFTGQSLVTAPDASVLLTLGPAEVRAAVVEIDPRAALDKHMTPRNHILQDRRPEYYW